MEWGRGVEFTSSGCLYLFDLSIFALKRKPTYNNCHIRVKYQNSAKCSSQSHHTPSVYCFALLYFPLSLSLPATISTHFEDFIYCFSYLSQRKYNIDSVRWIFFSHAYTIHLINLRIGKNICLFWNAKHWRQMRMIRRALYFLLPRIESEKIQIDINAWNENK